MTELLKPGQLFASGRYRVERFLAQGGMGAVFVAEQIATEADVAIKVLWPHVLGSKQALAKFQTEAKIAARVKSEFIVKVIDAGVDDELKVPFLAMELLSGESLQEFVESRGPCNVSDTLLLMRQFGAGLDRAHSYVDKKGVAKPIVHRDLKPDNLFVTQRDAGEPLVKILDYGLAKVVSETTDLSRDVKGTPLYMAYEQALGEEITPQTDIWALGLIVFFTMTGKSYWKTAHKPDTGMTALFAEVINLPLASASERAQELGVSPPWPATFDAWFAGCVNRDPAARFRTAGDAVEALAQALGSTHSYRPVAAPSTPPSSGVPAVSGYSAHPLSAHPLSAHPPSAHPPSHPPHSHTPSSARPNHSRSAAAPPQKTHRGPWTKALIAAAVVAAGLSGISQCVNVSKKLPTISAGATIPDTSARSEPELDPAPDAEAMPSASPGAPGIDLSKVKASSTSVEPKVEVDVDVDGYDVEVNGSQVKVRRKAGQPPKPPAPPAAAGGR